MIMVLIVAEFIPDIEQYQHAAGKADGKAGDVDKRIAFLLFNVSQCDF
jgi:hypothetical protein